MKAHDQYVNTIAWKGLAFYCFFTFATYQYSKIYFPYGIIVRRSIPTTPAQYVMRRAPICLVFTYLWYRQREYPRKFRADMTSDTEQ